MKYMLLLHCDPDAVADPVTEDGPDAPIQDWLAYTDALLDAGVLVAGEGLQPAHTATTLKVRAGERLLTDGPFMETKDLLLGFYVIDVDDLDSALDWAARLPMTGQLSVEVWPVTVTAASASDRVAAALSAAR